MALQAAIVIFPTVRLSELRANVQRDRLKLQSSRNELRFQFHDKTRPFRLLISKPGLLVGALASVFALYEVGTSVLSPVPGGKAVNGAARKGIGLLARFTRFGLGMAMKTAAPVISAYVQRLWQKAFKDNPFKDSAD